MSLLERFKLDGRVAVVTGAGRGIGRACALALADAGADLVLLARTHGDLQAVADEVAQRGRRALVLSADVSDVQAMPALVEQAAAHFGRLDILVNNAGGAGPNDPRRTSMEDFERALVWNTRPAFQLIQLVAPVMKKGQGGAVVNISSVAARYAQRHFSAYGAAKAALNQLTRNLAQDYAPHVRINAIEPGAILTDALAPFLDEQRMARMVQTTPMARMGQPEDIAAAVLFLCSPAASWITGKVLGVDGGVEAPNFS